MIEITALPHGQVIKTDESFKGIALVDHDAGVECMVAQLFDNYLDGVNRIHHFSALFQHAESMEALLQQAVGAWPQFDADTEVSGADLVSWFAEFRETAKELLLKIKQEEQLSCTDQGIQSLQGRTDPL